MRFITVNNIAINVKHIVRIESETVSSIVKDEYHEIYIIDTLGDRHQYYPSNPRDDIKNIMNEVINFINGGDYNATD